MRVEHPTELPRFTISLKRSTQKSLSYPQAAMQVARCCGNEKGNRTREQAR
jgi:hypothetical protein